MRVLLLDCNFEIAGAEKLSFRSTASLFDFDLVMWDPAASARRYITPYQALYRGKPSLSEAESVAFTEDVARRRREMSEFLKLGRTLVVFACGPQVFYVDTGERKTSGTGRNQKVTRLVSDVDLLTALPFALRSTPARGLEIEPANDIVLPLWRATRGDWVYDCILDEFPGDPIMRVAGTTRIVASLMQVPDGGLIAVMPEPYLEADDEEDEEESDGPADEEEDEKGEEAQPRKGAAEVAVDDAPPDDSQRVPEALLAWLLALQPGSDEPAPAWAGTFLFQSEVERMTEIAQHEQELAKITVGLDALKQSQAEDEQWKRLIYSDGQPLERQVQAAFEILGFTVDEHRPGRSDLRLTTGDSRVVVEVKGATKSAAERHSAQLEKWVAEELAEGVRAKGVLVVNAWREKEPDSRPAVFPEQMLEYARARGHCLLSGLQLLAMTRAVQAGSFSPQEAVASLVDTVGVLQGFDDASALLQRPPLIDDSGAL